MHRPWPVGVQRHTSGVAFPAVTAPCGNSLLPTGPEAVMVFCCSLSMQAGPDRAEPAGRASVAPFPGGTAASRSNDWERTTLFVASCCSMTLYLMIVFGPFVPNTHLLPFSYPAVYVLACSAATWTTCLPLYPCLSVSTVLLRAACQPARRSWTTWLLTSSRSAYVVWLQLWLWHDCTRCLLIGHDERAWGAQLMVSA